MTVEFRLTPDQEQAVDSLETDCIVSAGAGSGKTRVLVERFLRILEHHREDPDILEKIVAITFTEKAATEMKGRVRKEMKSRLITAREQGDEGQAEVWHRLLTETEGTRIHTIHSFCTRLLKEHPVEADVDPGFSVLDEVEARILLQEAVEASLPRVVEAKGPGVAELEQWVTARGVESSVSWLVQAYTLMAGNGWEPEELRRRTREDLCLVAERLEREWREGKAALSIAADALLQVKGGKRVQAFQQAWPGLSPALTTAETPKALLPLLTELKKLLKGSFGRKEELPLLQDQMKEQVERLWRVAEGRRLLPVERKLSEGMISVLAEVHRRYTRVKEERSTVDFDELQTRAVRLLQEYPAALKKVRGQIRYLMVDEYQDTNEAQKQLVDLLCKGPEGETVPGKLFVVGDSKQSIYRFRGAEVSVFGDTRGEILSRGGREVALLDNFRSEPSLVHFVNVLFGGLMSRDPDSPNHYRETVAKREPKEGLRVEYLPLPEKKECPEGKEPRDVEAERIAHRIGELMEGGVPPGKIALLFQAMTHVKRYEQALVRRGIPFYVVKGRGFYDQQEILDVLHYLRFLSDPGDVFSLIGVLRSPFCGVSDGTILTLSRVKGWEQEPTGWPEVEGLAEGERIKLAGFAAHLTRARRWMGRMSVAELMEGLLKDSGYHHVLWGTPQGKQARANLDKLIDQARVLQKRQGFSLDAFLRSVEEWQGIQQETEAAVEPEEGNSVKLMTIHQSKGLEFPVVFVPDLSREPNRNPSVVGVERERGLVVRLRGVEGAEGGDSFRWLEWKEREQQLEREESLRLFYVAVTRAENRLILSGVPTEHKGTQKGKEILSAGTWSRWLDVLFGYREIDWEKKIWEPEGHGVAVRVWPWQEDGAEPVPLQGASQLDSGWLSDRESAFSPGEPVPEAIQAMEPRGWKREDRLEISVSDLMMLINCPRKFFYARMLGISFPDGQVGEPEGGELRREEDFSLSPQLKGEMVHRMIEEAPESPDDAFYEQIMDIFGVPSSKRTGVRREVRPLFEMYLNSDLHPAGTTEEVKKEKRFIRIHEGLEVEGIIDRLHPVSDGSWELVDYKTNEVDAAAMEEAAVEYLSQLQLYVLAARESWGMEVSRATLFFLKPGKKRSWEVNREWLQQAEENFIKTSRILRRGREVGDFPPHPGKRCGYCDYRKICEAAKG